MICYMCQKETRTRHLPIYAMGSEGVNLCDKCIIEITEFVRDKARQTVKAKLNEWKLLNDSQKTNS